MEIFQPETDNLDVYLISDDVVNWQEPLVLSKARGLVAGLKNEVEKARCLFHWVRDEIPHSKDIETEVVTCSASEVLQAGTGICYAKSHLLAALLRANGIPAGFCYQVLRHDPPLDGLVVHGLNGIYLSSLQKWIRVDARGNTKGINAQFGIEREQLAFPMDPRAGEFIYDKVYVSPAPTVVRVLRKYKTRSAMWPSLPSRLKDED